MSWTNATLGEVFEVSRGGSPRPIEDYLTDEPDGLNWVLIGDATSSGKLIASTKKRIRKEGLSKTRTVKPGDFLLSNSMSFGRPYIMGVAGCIHDGWLLLRPKADQVHADFFYYLLGSSEVYQRLASRAAGATVKNLNSEIVREVEISFPPLDEQRRIAAILDQAEDLRRKRREALDLLERHIRASFDDLFGDPIINPLGFPQLALEEIIDPQRPITYGILMPGPHVDEGVSYVRVIDIQYGAILLGGVRRTSSAIADQYRRSMLRAGDVLISIRGHVGRLAIVPPELDGANVTQDTARLAVTTAEPIFVKSLLETPQAKNWLDRRTKGAAVKGLNLGDLRKFPVILPPPALQRAFAARVAEIDQLKVQHRAHLAQLDALFASLQHRAFRGEL